MISLVVLEVHFVKVEVLLRGLYEVEYQILWIYCVCSTLLDA